MKRSRMALVLLATAGALALVFTSATLGGTTKKAASPYKVALILVGPHNDGGWSQAHYAGLQYVQKALGSKVQFDVQGEHRRRGAVQPDRREPRRRRATR